LELKKNTRDTPYYLKEEYTFPKNNNEGKKITVRAAHIYTRIGDTNTPKTDTADMIKVSIYGKSVLV